MAKVKILSEAEFKDDVYPIMRQIFIGDDVYNCPFADWVNEKKLLYEVLYELKSPMLEAVVQAASQIGDRGFYVSSLLDLGPSFDHHWYIPFEDIDSYKTIFSLRVENAIFSPSAKWGIIASEEDFAIIGGTNEFMEIVKELIPNMDEQLQEFLITRQYESQRNYPIGWIPSVLKSVLKCVLEEREADYYLDLYGLTGKP